MNKIKYWKKKLYLADIIYRNTINVRTGIFERAFNIVCEINDYLFNMEDDIMDEKFTLKELEKLANMEVNL